MKMPCTIFSYPMNRIPVFPRLFLFLTFAGALVMSAFSAVPQPLNVVYILADDLGYGDLGCYGQKLFETPNIDKLAAEGMLFTRHYSGSTVCAPSRSSLLTGQDTGHTPIRGNFEVRPEGQMPLPGEVVTVAEMFQNAGYATGAFGKWGLGYPGSEGDPLNQGFDEFFGYNCQRLGHHYYPYHLWSNREKVMLEENAGKAKGLYAPNLIHDRVLDFIERQQDRPFFCFVPSIIPHAELAAPEALMEQFRGKLLPEKSYSGLDDGPKYREGPYESQAETRAAFAAMVTLLDRQVGEIRQKLAELGLAERTLIVFSSDNGAHQEGGAAPRYFGSSGGLRGFKRDLYEGGIRVPMIAAWPGVIPAGSRTRHVSAFWDVYPTFAEIVGGAAPQDSQGISFLPTLKGESGQRQHEYLYWEFHERGGRLALLQGEWKAVRYGVAYAPDKPVELFNLDSDPGEKRNRAQDFPGIAARLSRLIEGAREPSPIPKFNFPVPE